MEQIAGLEPTRDMILVGAVEVINQRFVAGEVKVICSVRTMTTGVDLPVSCIIDAAPTKSEMLHVQKIGRGLREKPEGCIILDHAGNSIRLGLVSDIHHDTLDKTPRGERQKRNAGAEKLPTPCSKCETLFSGKTCPACGQERVRVAGVEWIEGELVQITPKKFVPTKIEKQRFWSMALFVDEKRKKGGRLAKSLYKRHFGVWPSQLHHVQIEPDQSFMNFEKSHRIAYAKLLAKQRRQS